MAIRKQHVRRVVDELLGQHRIKKAPVDVDAIATQLGIEVQRDVVDEDMSGFLFRDARANKAIIGVNGAHVLTRQRFTVAHELGHFLLHAGEPVHIDRANTAFRVNHRDARSSMGVDDSEREANLFAAELLMPAQFLERDLRNKNFDLLDDDAVRVLASQYQVSAQALTFRLANLGYVHSNL